MSKNYVHPATNRMLKQKQEDTLVTKAKAGYIKAFERTYWMVNKRTNRRSDRTVTTDEFLAYVGHNYAVAKGYELVPAW